MATFFHGHSSVCRSTRSKQCSLSKGEAVEMESVEEHYFDEKQSKSQFRKQISFSTLSICQSHYEATAMGRVGIFNMFSASRCLHWPGLVPNSDMD